jgi:hypothetical protein
VSDQAEAEEVLENAGACRTTCTSGTSVAAAHTFGVGKALSLSNLYIRNLLTRSIVSTVSSALPFRP